MNTPISTIPNPYLDPSLTCTEAGFPDALVVGVGPVFTGVTTVTCVTVCTMPLDVVRLV